MLKPGSSERGAVIVLFAVMLVVIIVCTALVVDIGHIHNAKAELQRAVDAAALAAAARLPDGQYAAAAVAVGAQNTVDGDPALILPANVVRGWWDPEITPGATAATRFDPTSTPYTAVRVSATYNVDHAFFFFTPFTTVQADAIAVTEPFMPVLPLALVSCVETDKYPLKQPVVSVCGIRAYDFGPDPSDTAAWTSLTFDVNANEVREFMEGQAGHDKFNSVVFGEGIDGEGLENTDVDNAARNFDPDYLGCNPEDIDIDCGLGQIGTKRIAPPEDFDSPDGIVDLDHTGPNGTYKPTAFDPLTAYTRNGQLPRWYNLNETDNFQQDDHFARIWSQDGILMRGTNTDGTFRESVADYEARLESYYNGTVKPYGDLRFVNTGDGGGGLVTKRGSKYLPNFLDPLKFAGYPKVYVFNGTATTILDNFIDPTVNPGVTDGTNLIGREDDDLPDGQIALVLNTPVIFAGDCDQFRAMSQSNDEHELRYIGMSKFLMTRLWKSPDEYDTGSNFVNVSGCPGPFDPPTGPGGDLSKVNVPGAKIMEGLKLLPMPDGEGGSITKIYLVE